MHLGSDSPSYTETTWKLLVTFNGLDRESDYKNVHIQFRPLQSIVFLYQQ